MAEAIASVLTDTGLRERLVTRGRARARLFTWETVARETLAVYEDVGPPGRSPGAAVAPAPAGPPPSA